MAVLFARFKVADLESFKRLHSKVGAAQSAYRLTEAVWQSVDDPRSLTITIRGSRKDIERWLKSTERAQLSLELEVDSSGGNWLTQELFSEGEYGI